MKTLSLDVFGIKISWSHDDRIDATISSEMRKSSSAAHADINSQIKAIESMVLNHFKAGLNINSEPYIQGIRASYQDAIMDCLEIDRDETLRATHKIVNGLCEIDADTLLEQGISKMLELSENDINKIARQAVSKMGDIFWSTADFEDGEENPFHTAKRCVKDAIVEAFNVAGKDAKEIRA